MTRETAFIVISKETRELLFIILAEPGKGVEQAIEIARAFAMFGEMYACQMSNEAFDAVHRVGKDHRSEQLKLIKRYSHSMQKCADVT